jgi:hypothetical protein
MPEHRRKNEIEPCESLIGKRLKFSFNGSMFENLMSHNVTLVVTYSRDVDSSYKAFIDEIIRFWKYVGARNKKFDSLKVEVMADASVNRDHFKSSSFLIFNTPTSPVFSQYMDPAFPIKLKEREIIIGDTSYQGGNLQLSFTIYNPFNRDRFIAFIIGTTAFPSYHFHIPLLGEYCLSRLPHFDETLEKGTFEFSSEFKAVGIKSRKQFQEDSEWLALGSEHFLFYLRPDLVAQKEIESIKSIHEQAYERTTSYLGKRTNKDMFQCYIHEKESEEGTTGWVKPFSNIMHTVYNDESKRKYSGPHEVTHAVLNNHVGCKHLKCFSEGIADLLNWDDDKDPEFNAAESLYSNALLKIGDLAQNDIFKECFSSDVYKQSASLTRFLTDRFGWGRFLEMVRETSGQNSNLRNAFQNVYSLSPEEVGKDWKSLIVDYLCKHRIEIEKQRLLRAANRSIYYKRYGEALDLIGLSLMNNDKNPYKHYLAGKCHFLMGIYELAEGSFSRSVSLPLQFEDDTFVYRRSYLYLGKIHDLTGEREEAIKCYNLVLGYPEYDDCHDHARRFLKKPYKGESCDEPG